MDENSLPYRFTIPGRILLLATLLVACTGPVISLYVLRDTLSPGTIPLIALAGPFLVFAFIAFLVGCKLLRRMGIAVKKDDIVLPNGQVVPKEPEHEQEDDSARY